MLRGHLETKLCKCKMHDAEHEGDLFLLFLERCHSEVAVQSLNLILQFANCGEMTCWVEPLCSLHRFQLLGGLDEHFSTTF